MRCSIMLRYKQRVVKGFKAFSNCRKPAGNAFQNPLETQFQVVSRVWNSLKTLWKPFENLHKPFGNSLQTLWKPFRNPVCGIWNPLETLWKLFRNHLEFLYNPVSGIWNPLESRFQEFETLWKPFWNPASPKLPCLIKRFFVWRVTYVISKVRSVFPRFIYALGRVNPWLLCIVQAHASFSGIYCLSWTKLVDGAETVTETISTKLGISVDIDGPI